MQHHAFLWPAYGELPSRQNIENRNALRLLNRRPAAP